jgi:hypothetical protein
VVDAPSQELQMNRRSIVAVAGALTLLALSACGSDADSSSELSDAQSAAAESAIESAAAGGVTLDQGCVEEVAAQLSEEDAQLAADDPEAQLSDAGESLGIELLSCADEGEIIDLFIAGMSEGGAPLDEDCARTALEDVDVKEIIASAGGGDVPADLVTALTPCLGG